MAQFCINFSDHLLKSPKDKNRIVIRLGRAVGDKGMLGMMGKITGLWIIGFNLFLLCVETVI